MTEIKEEHVSLDFPCKLMKKVRTSPGCIKLRHLYRQNTRSIRDPGRIRRQQIRDALTKVGADPIIQVLQLDRIDYSEKGNHLALLDRERLYSTILDELTQNTQSRANYLRQWHRYYEETSLSIKLDHRILARENKIFQFMCHF